MKMDMAPKKKKTHLIVLIFLSLRIASKVNFDRERKSTCIALPSLVQR